MRASVPASVESFACKPVVDSSRGHVTVALGRISGRPRLKGLNQQSRSHDSDMPLVDGFHGGGYLHCDKQCDWTIEKAGGGVCSQLIRGPNQNCH